MKKSGTGSEVRVRLEDRTVEFLEFLKERDGQPMLWRLKPVVEAWVEQYLAGHAKVAAEFAAHEARLRPALDAATRGRDTALDTALDTARAARDAARDAPLDTARAPRDTTQDSPRVTARDAPLDAARPGAARAGRPAPTAATRRRS